MASLTSHNVIEGQLAEGGWEGVKHCMHGHTSALGCAFWAAALRASPMSQLLP